MTQRRPKNQVLREVAASEQASIIRKTGVTEKERHPDNDEHGGP